MDSSDPLSGFDMESFVLEITEDQYSGETSILPWNNPIEQVVTTSEHGDDVLGRLELMPQRVDARYLICLTIGIGGLQVVWTAIMSQGSPFLNSLGVPTYLISLIWLAGPLSGALVQPYVGTLSDRCRHSWGRRKPFIIFGTIATIICMLALPRSSGMVDLIFIAFGGDLKGHTARVSRGVLAAAWIWALNLSIQPVQAGIRAFIIDSCPPEQQVQASAYSSCVTNLGGIVGYASGLIVLPRVAPWLGGTQFQALCLIASIALGSTVFVSCLTIKEQAVMMEDDAGGAKPNIKLIFRQLSKTSGALPERIKQVCMVQFFAWIGWFPFLFYITSYIGDLYQAETILSDPIHTIYTPAYFHDPIRPISVRYGTLALIIVASIAFLTNLILPRIVTHTTLPVRQPARHSEELEINIEPPSPSSSSSSSTPINEKLTELTDSPTEQTTFLRHIPSSLSLSSPARTQDRSINRWLTLPHVWTASHILTSITLFSTAFTHARVPSTVLVALLGIPWGLTQWIPFALISAEIAAAETSPTNDHTLPIDEEKCQHPSTHDGRDLRLQAGAIMGVHNAAIATPQIVAAIGSSCLFWILARWDIVGGDAVGWILRSGGVATCVAAWMASRIV